MESVMHAKSAIALAFSRWRTFLSSTKAGGMSIALAFVLMFMSTVGAALSNYAWHEAQWEELESAQRAAVAALGPLLGENADSPAVTGRLLEYVEAMQPGFDATTPTIVRGADDVISVTFGGTFAVDDIWGGGGNVAEAVAPNTIRVKLEHERYEIAMALDVSGSMACLTDNCKIPDGNGGRIRKLDALKQAMEAAADALESTTRNTPGSLMTSVVPFASLVNVADTATAGRTEAKEGYVRMLAGAVDNGQPLDMQEVLRHARDDRDDGVGQWVDTFHGYGVGKDLGPLRSRGLPDDLLDDKDWNLRREGVKVDVGEQFARKPPDGRTWMVDDKDFWNGCLMARWGAYWNPKARSAGFDANPTDGAHWPARTDVPGWSPAAPMLPDVPLHLSDAPPDRDDPHSLFTAYSWPDASIAVPDDDKGPDKDAGSADHWLQVAMVRLLDTGPNAVKLAGNRFPLTANKFIGHNHWNRAGGGGDAMCPGTPITPLTDDLATVRRAVRSLTGVKEAFQGAIIDPNGPAETYMVRGLVWALRTVSPLWEPVWQAEDVRGLPRPGVTCAQGEAGSCDVLLKKSILLVADGANFVNQLETTRLPELVVIPGSPGTKNRIPEWSAWSTLTCDDPRTRNDLDEYHTAWTAEQPTYFNRQFAHNGAMALTGESRFHVVGKEQEIEDAFRWNQPPGFSVAPLGDFTPWELFRGPYPAGTQPSKGSYDFATDMLMAEMGLRGRPMRLTGYCGPFSAPGPYGSVDDYVLVAHKDDSDILPPVRNVAPFQHPPTQHSPLLPRDRPGVNQAYNAVRSTMLQQLDTWFLEACALARQRGVRVNAVYIGDVSRYTTAHIDLLEDCVAAAGGDPAKDVYVTPKADDLKRAFEEQFAVRRNLRFLS